MDNFKEEILRTEADFCAMASSRGIKEAFLAFAAEDGVINRDNKIFKGRKEIGEYFENQNIKETSLEWKPDFVDVSASGDMGYTVGGYTLRFQDSGKETVLTGVFHTVWKRQKDGKWKFVYD